MDPVYIVVYKYSPVNLWVRSSRWFCDYSKSDIPALRAEILEELAQQKTFDLRYRIIKMSQFGTDIGISDGSL